VPQFPSDDRHDKDRYPDVACYEVIGIPRAFQEDTEAADKYQNRGADETIPSGEWLQRSFPRESITADTLDFKSAVEANVAETQRSPGDQTCDRA